MNPVLRPAEHRAISTFQTRPAVLRVLPDVQHYAWGDSRFIPSLLGTDNPTQKPFAELWMGAHPDLPAKAKLHGAEIPLNVLVDRSAAQVLGPDVAAEFGGHLPYLLKVLSAATPLSIQVHPTKAQAEIGFARENKAGVPLSANERNYKDNNHKPELIAALTDFYALYGFRPLAEIARVLREVPEFRPLMPQFEPTSGCLQALYDRCMNLPHQNVDAVLNTLVTRLTEADKEKRFSRADREYWVLRADREFSHEDHRDRGLFSIYLLNLVHLRPGEALYLPAGVLHAYLEGSGMEIMASSNNVLRGGLTPKHVDVPELLRNVIFAEVHPVTVRGEQIAGTREWAYTTPVREFELRRIEIDREQPFSSDGRHSADILILISNGGAGVELTSAARKIELDKGDVCLVPAGLQYAIRGRGPATLYKATVPMFSNPSAAAMPLFRGRRPTALRFGTSGLRGLVTDITDLEAYVNTRGFLDYLASNGDVQSGATICIAGDLRPSSDSHKRSIMRAVARAVEDAGLKVENLGKIPTPALMAYAVGQGHPSVMVTGSHIPFDRNGIKFNTKSGEILKQDEAGILKSVDSVRKREYDRPEAQSIFHDDGMFKETVCSALPAVNNQGAQAYVQRYRDFFADNGLQGKRIVFFQHSAVGRDLLVDLLEALGAEVHPAGRSDTFIAIDTEDIGAELLANLQAMAADVAQKHGPIDALVSTDGDSDRPLLCGIDPGGKVRFIGGDLLGVLVAEYLEADCVTVPISANDAVDTQLAKRGTKVTKTRIGSPYVIAAMRLAESGGKCERVVGWEANGGFLTGSTIEKDGRTLGPLPTRDAVLPLLCALYFALEDGGSLVDAFGQLPPRFSKAGLIDQFPQASSRAIVRRFSPTHAGIEQVDFEGQSVSLLWDNGRRQTATESMADAQRAIRRELMTYFATEIGFDDIVRINTIDGVRIYFRNGDVAHIRPSGNAPQLRIYAVADTQARADEIIDLGLREPDGVLRSMETAIRT